MEVVVVESTAFQKLTATLETAVCTIKEVIRENQSLKDDRWMDLEEAAKHVGFERQWLLKRKTEIGCSQKGSAIRFKKTALDAYMMRDYLKETGRKAK